MTNLKLPPAEWDKIKKITEKAIEAGYNKVSAEWRECALEVLYEVCQSKETFTVNDVRGEVKKVVKERGITPPDDNRVMGGLMKNAESMGWIIPSGNTIPSKVGHKVPIQIWRSMVYVVGHKSELSTRHDSF